MLKKKGKALVRAAPNHVKNSTVPGQEANGPGWDVGKPRLSLGLLPRGELKKNPVLSKLFLIPDRGSAGPERTFQKP